MTEKFLSIPLNEQETTISFSRGSELHSLTSRRRKEFNASEPYKIPMGCSDCIHYSYCMERRGYCKEFKTLEMIRREINALNENQKTASATAEGDNEAGPR